MKRETGRPSTKELESQKNKSSEKKYPKEERGRRVELRVVRNSEPPAPTAELKTPDTVSLHTPETQPTFGDTLRTNPRVFKGDLLTDEQMKILEDVIDPERFADTSPALTSKTPYDLLDMPSGWHNYWVSMIYGKKLENEEKALRRQLAKIIKKTNLHPTRVLYPGAGFDTLPRDMFGSDKVVHLSLEEAEFFPIKAKTDKRKHRGTHDMDIIGDVQKMPFHDGSFDTVYLNGLPPASFLAHNMLGLKEIDRVLSPGGKIIVANTFAGPTIIREMERRYKEITSRFALHVFEKPTATPQSQK